MKTLIETTGCRFALTTSEAPNRHPFGTHIGPSYEHLFCDAPQRAGSSYCEKHHQVCCRGEGKDARALEEMIYAVDQSQFRGSTGYAEHTDPMDEEVKKGGTQ